MKPETFRYIVFALLAILSLCLTSCATYQSDGSVFSFQRTFSWQKVFDDMAEELCSEQSGACTNDSAECNKSGHTFLVTDFVDIQTFAPHYTGILFGELIRSSLSKQCHAKIIEAEFSKYFKLSEKGLVALTRSPNEIRFDEYPYSQCIVGTYSHNRNGKIFIFVRKISTTTGKISRIVSREIDTKDTVF